MQNLKKHWMRLRYDNDDGDGDDDDDDNDEQLALFSVIPGVVVLNHQQYHHTQSQRIQKYQVSQTTR